VSFLGLLVDQGRIADLPAIADALAARAAATRQREVAEVRTAVPLDEATLERITSTLEKATGRSLEVRTVVDPAILGGIVARIGDTVIDGSVRRRLESLRETLQARS
jgi:F-type H+-transporting ATPase subunit delta